MALMHERGGVAGTEYKEQPSSQIMHGASSEFPRLELQGSTTGCGDLHADDNDACKENEMFESDTSLSFQTEHMSSAASTNCRAAMPEATRLCDIVGHDNAKLRIEEVLLSISPRFSRFMTGIRALPASILLSGPPGCGKVSASHALPIDVNGTSCVHHSCDRLTVRSHRSLSYRPSLPVPSRGKLEPLSFP
jgi:hypothetical protein